METQKHLFNLPDDLHYLNCAYMSPLMTHVEQAGIMGIQRKTNPAEITPADFFRTAELVRQKFATLIQSKPEQIAIIPSVSYGIQAAVNNLPLNNGKQAIVVGDEFPSDYYALEDWCKKNNKELHIVASPENKKDRGKIWNETLLSAITNDTAVVVLSAVHWTDGTLFDLQQIGTRCRETNTRFIVDGTQAVGALPIHVEACKIDALICAAYKWLMGPYSIGLAYYSPIFDNGTPLEFAWVNRENADDFTSLLTYTPNYSPAAGRYNVGEYGNFILLPMVDAALQQIINWDTQQIQNYCRQLIQPALSFLTDNGFHVEAEPYRANHLFGFILPEHIQKEALLKKLKAEKIIVSTRGNAIRISPNVYNTPEDIDTLINALKN